jgi:hypothetical protein
MSDTICFKIETSVEWKARVKYENNCKRKRYLGLIYEAHEESRIPLRSSAFEYAYF